MSKGKKVLVLLGLLFLGYAIYYRPERVGETIVAVWQGLAHGAKSIFIVFDVVLEHIPAKR
jgi:hypothetical protein